MTEHADEIEFGSPEHIAGLSRKALEEDFAWTVGRNRELEGICERLDAENAKLRELVRDLRKALIHGNCYRWCDYMPEPCNGHCQYLRRMRELEIEVE